MTDKQYIIGETDYIRHIDEKIELYEMLKDVISSVKKLPLTPYVRLLTDKAKRCETEADSLFAEWDIPNTYLTDGDTADLRGLMRGELTELEPGTSGEYYDDYESDAEELIEIAHELNDICGRLIDYADNRLDDEY